MGKTVAQTADAAGTADAVDTSTDDERELDDDTTDDFEAGWDEGEEVSDSDSEESEAAATDDDSDDEEDSDDDVDETEDSKEDEDSEDQEAEADSTDAEDEDKPADKQDDANLTEEQRRNREAAARRVATKSKRQEVTDLAQKEWIAQGKNQTQRDVRELKIQAYNNQIRDTEVTLKTGIGQAQQEHHDLFNSKDTLVAESMLEAIDTFEAKFVEKDEFGNLIGIRVDPFTGELADVHQYLQKEADRIRGLTKVGAKQQEQAKKSQKKRVATLPSRKPVRKTDPMMDAFDEEADS
jgi:hypothetical protein